MGSRPPDAFTQPCEMFEVSLVKDDPSTSNADFYETFVPETKQHRQMEGCAFTTGTAGSEPLKWSCRKPGRQERVPLGDESHKVTSETIPSVTEGLHNTLQQL